MSDATLSFKLTRDIPDRYLTEIGRAVVEWSFLEDIVNLGISGLLKLSPAMGRKITLPIRNFRQRLQILKSLTEATAKGDADKEAFKLTFKVIEDAYKERNHLAHAVWWAADEIDNRIIQIVKPGDPITDHSVESIRQASIKIRAASDALTNFLAGPEGFEWPKTSHPKP